MSSSRAGPKLTRSWSIHHEGDIAEHAFLALGLPGDVAEHAVVMLADDGVLAQHAFGAPNHPVRLADLEGEIGDEDLAV